MFFSVGRLFTCTLILYYEHRKPVIVIKYTICQKKKKKRLQFNIFSKCSAVPAKRQAKVTALCLRAICEGLQIDQSRVLSRPFESRHFLLPPTVFVKEKVSRSLRGDSEGGLKPFEPFLIWFISSLESGRSARSRHSCAMLLRTYLTV